MNSIICFFVLLFPRCHRFTSTWRCWQPRREKVYSSTCLFSIVDITIMDVSLHRSRGKFVSLLDLSLGTCKLQKSDYRKKQRNKENMEDPNFNYYFNTKCAREGENFSRISTRFLPSRAFDRMNEAGHVRDLWRDACEYVVCPWLLLLYPRPTSPTKREAQIFLVKSEIVFFSANKCQQHVVYSFLHHPMVDVGVIWWKEDNNRPMSWGRRGEFVEKEKWRWKAAEAEAR